MVLLLVITVAATEEPEQVLAAIHQISVKYIYGLAQGLFGMWILLE